MGQTPTPLSDARAPAAPITPAAVPAGGAVPVREVPVAKGQIVQATVVAVEGEAVWLGWRGSVFEARSLQSLEAGKSYDFVVSATEPNIVLTAAKAMKNECTAAASPLPGSSGAGLLRALVAMLAALPDAALQPRADGPAPDLAFARALRAFGDGKATATDLQTLQRGLGHDQEARVLRLASLPQEQLAAEVQSLRTTRKAAAMALLADSAVSDQVPRDAVHRALAFTSGMNGVERDNAQRADQGLPLWLPLPACPAQGLRDARMFLLAEDRSGSERNPTAADGAFTVVLLLDLTRLGELRVDIALRGERIDATFLAVQPGATAMLANCADELRAALTAAGMQVDRLAVRQAKGSALPIADLALPPRDGSALVDCHA